MKYYRDFQNGHTVPPAQNASRLTGSGDWHTDDLMDMIHIVRLMDRVEAAPKTRGHSKKKAA